jgi:hypothetical protein
MKRRRARLLLAGLALVAAPEFAHAQEPVPARGDTLPPAPPRVEASAGSRGASRFYYGGTIGLGFSDQITRVSVQPMLGYKLSPKASIGTRIGYEYYQDSRPEPDIVSHNYGGSAFTRYRLFPQAYAHAEFEYMSYDLGDGRAWVPFLLLGGGYTQPISKKSQLMVEVLFDVLQDPKSPYKPWEPQVSVGVGVGF